MSSHAASISDWNAVLLCPSIVAALIVSRQVVESSSAARRNTAARSSQAQRLHSVRAAVLASMACWTRSGVALCQVPSACWCACGMTTGAVSPVRNS